MWVSSLDFAWGVCLCLLSTCTKMNPITSADDRMTHRADQIKIHKRIPLSKIVTVASVDRASIAYYFGIN